MSQETIIRNLLQDNPHEAFSVRELASEVSYKQGLFDYPPNHSIRRAISNLVAAGFPITNLRAGRRGAEYTWNE